MTWNPTNEAALKSHWESGLSCSQIGREIGKTRNAVIGKIHRMGLSGRKRKSGPKAARAGRRKTSTLTGQPVDRAPHTKLVRHHNFQSGLTYEILETAPELPPEPAETPVNQRRTLLELTDDTCRWPIGDVSSPDFFFCGGTSVESLPYCSYHCHIAYQPASGRRNGGYGVLRSSIV